MTPTTNSGSLTTLTAQVGGKTQPLIQQTVTITEETSTASSSGLTNDAATGQYKYTWKTLKSYGGSCYQLRLTLTDGST